MVVDTYSHGQRDQKTVKVITLIIIKLFVIRLHKKGFKEGIWHKGTSEGRDSDYMYPEL